MWHYSPDIIIGTPFSHITLDILYFVEGGRVWKMGAYNVILQIQLILCILGLLNVSTGPPFNLQGVGAVDFF